MGGTESAGSPKIAILAEEYGLSVTEATAVLGHHHWDLDMARDTLQAQGRRRKPQQHLITNAPANPAPQTTGPAKTAEELEIEKAIALSLQMDTGNGGGGGAGGAEQVDPNVDPELAQALLLSKQESDLGVNRAPVIDLTGEGGGDELQATLLASIQTAQGRAPIVTNDPNTLARQGDLPVGLKNVGNTCYLNSLIQTYFMIPVLRKAVISYKPAEPVPAEIDKNPNHIFMLELQKLFCAMVLSNQRFVDPSNLLKKIVDDAGKPVSIGAQEDVSEFNDIFMTRLTKGLDLVHPPPEGAVPNPLTVSTNSQLLDDTELTNGRLQRMFQPSVMELLKSQEPDGSPIEQSHPIDFGRNFILPVNEETDLFTSLDQFMFDDVSDWETPGGNKAPAQRWKWLRHTPEVLFFQQQRAQWSGEGNMKTNHRLNFPEVLHMDRYGLQHAPLVSSIRASNVARQAALAQVQAQIEPYNNYPEGGTKLDSVLAGTIRYLELLVAQNRPGSGDQIDLMRKSVDLLRTCQAEEAEKLKELQHQREVLEAELAQSYASINSEPYRLFAVWVHAGAAVGGHYWAYIKDVLTDDWYKLNDTDSNRVELPKVLEDGYGGQGVTSAYFLIYMKESLYHRCKLVQDRAAGMPDAIRAAVGAENEQFEKKLKEHRENGLEGKMERFVTSYKNKLEQTQEYAHKYTVERDMRYYSVFAYLLSIGMADDMQAAVASEMWLRTFGSGIGKSQNTVEFEKLLTQEIPGTSVLFKAVALNENEADRKRRTEWDANHAAFRTVFMFANAAMQLMMKPYSTIAGLTDKQDALRHLFLAYIRNGSVPHENTRRTDLEDLLHLAILLCLHESVSLCAAHLSTALSILDDVAYVILRLPTVISENLRAAILGATFETLPEQNPAFMEDPKTASIQDRLINSTEPTDRRWESYACPKMPMELAEWETFINTSRDTYENLKRKYLGIFPQAGLPELQLFLGPSAVAPQASTPALISSNAPPSSAMDVSSTSTTQTTSTQDTPHLSDDIKHMAVDVPAPNPDKMEVDQTPSNDQ